MNQQRKQILQQLKDAMDKGMDSDDFYQAMRLRPVPQELLREAMRRHYASKQIKTSMTPEKESWIRETLAHIFGPSQRSLDPKHPVGAVAQTIRALLGEFREWQI